MRFLAIDFETATASRDSACAVGVAMVDGGRIVSSASYLIRPPQNRYSPFNIAVHGITPGMTVDAAPFAHVMATVLEEADGLPLVAHNAGFDMSVLRAGFERSSRPSPRRDYYCTLLMSRSALPGLSDYRLPTVLDAVGGAIADHHDPRADAEACAEIALGLASLTAADTLEELGARVGMHAGQILERGYRPCRCSSGPRAHG